VVGAFSLTVCRAISLTLLTLFLAGCGYAGLSKREAIEVAAEGAKHQAHGRLAVRYALKRKTPEGHKVWLVEFRISPRRVTPWLGGRICALSFNNSAAYQLPYTSNLVYDPIKTTTTTRIWAVAGPCPDVESNVR
jgi:hypothetical protein